MAPFDENAPLPGHKQAESSFNLNTSTMSGIPTISTRTRSLGQSTGGKRIIPKRGPRTTSLTIPEDAEAPIKPRITSAPMRASVREEHGVLGETRGGGNIKRAVENLGDEKEGMVKEANSVAVERRIRVLEANCRTKEQKDAIKCMSIALSGRFSSQARVPSAMQDASTMAKPAYESD